MTSLLILSLWVKHKFRILEVLVAISSSLLSIATMPLRLTSERYSVHNSVNLYTDFDYQPRLNTSLIGYIKLSTTYLSTSTHKTGVVVMLNF